MKNKLYLSAGILCFLTALIHTIGGQLTLVDPLLDSQLMPQVKVEWLGGWHMITLLLWYFAYILLKNGMTMKHENLALLKSIAVLCILFSLSFIGASIYQQQHAAQYVFFLLIAFLTLLGYKNQVNLKHDY